MPVLLASLAPDPHQPASAMTIPALRTSRPCVKRPMSVSTSHHLYHRLCHCLRDWSIPSSLANIGQQVRLNACWIAEVCGERRHRILVHPTKLRGYVVEMLRNLPGQRGVRRSYGRSARKAAHLNDLQPFATPSKPTAPSKSTALMWAFSWCS